jgi:hypothetical protein
MRKQEDAAFSTRLTFYSELVPAGVPQGTKLGPWLFVVMVNDLDIPTSKLWRYADDTSMAETILKGGSSTIQNNLVPRLFPLFEVRPWSGLVT